MSNDLVNEEIAKLSKKERKAIRIANAGDAEFQQWASIEIAKAEALRRKQEAKPKAPPAENEPSPTAELDAMTDTQFRSYINGLGVELAGRNFEPTLSEEMAAYRASLKKGNDNGSN